MAHQTAGRFYQYCLGLTAVNQTSSRLQRTLRGGIKDHGMATGRLSGPYEVRRVVEGTRPSFGFLLRASTAQPEISGPPINGQDSTLPRMIPYEGQTCNNCKREAVPSDIVPTYAASSGSLQVQYRCPDCKTINDVLLKLNRTGERLGRHPKRSHFVVQNELVSATAKLNGTPDDPAVPNESTVSSHQRTALAFLSLSGPRSDLLELDHRMSTFEQNFIFRR